MIKILSCNRGEYIFLSVKVRGMLNDLESISKYKSIATSDNKRYYKDLSKTSSGQASRYPLAFFVPNVCLAPQAKQTTSTTPINLLAFKALMGNTVYDGLTLQNKRALRRICRAVTTSTESKTRHPILTVSNAVYSVALTHKLVGGSHHG